MDIKSQIWAPLNPARREIRLFILAPDEDQKSVPKGRLIVRSLEEQLHYDAISHAWGRPSFPEVVVIDGIEWLVSTGIFEALQRLRHKAEERCFWLDAICIDQSDLRERGEQVINPRPDPDPTFMDSVAHSFLCCPAPCFAGRKKSRLI
jgi:hypothetical protein